MQLLAASFAKISAARRISSFVASGLSHTRSRAKRAAWFAATFSSYKAAFVSWLRCRFCRALSWTSLFIFKIPFKIYMTKCTVATVGFVDTVGSFMHFATVSTIATIPTVGFTPAKMGLFLIAPILQTVGHQRHKTCASHRRCR